MQGNDSQLLKQISHVKLEIIDLEIEIEAKQMSRLCLSAKKHMKKGRINRVRVLPVLVCRV